MTSPVNVEKLASLLVNALEGVGTEIITLSLNQVGGQTGRADTIIVGKSGGDGRGGDTRDDGGSSNASPTGKSGSDLILEEAVQEKVGKSRVGIEGILDLAQELASDNAAASPALVRETIVKTTLKVGVMFINAREQCLQGSSAT
jgi:hypothetical protein